MYRVILDESSVLWDDTVWDEDRMLLSPMVKETISDTPTFEFGILPNHVLYEQITKFKSIITVYCNNRVMFHGRVIKDTVDFYGQKAVSCEGALGFLLDSVLAPITTGTVTPGAFLQQLITAHNTDMESDPGKRFTLGTIQDTALTDGTKTKKFKMESYQQTYKAIEDLLIKEYKGYLFARYESGTLYLDWKKTFTRENDQPVKMAVNMLDRSIEENTEDYYTVYLPIGENKKTIASVNAGSPYLIDTEAVAKYGRIVKAESFSDCKTPASLLEKAQEEFNKRGTNLPISIRVKAIDMHLLGNQVTEILLGDKLTNVEDRTGELITGYTVAEINFDLQNPENNEYVLENQEAIDQRSTSRGDGTISGRTRGVDNGLDENRRRLIKSYDEIQLTVRDNYTLTASSITEAATQIRIFADRLHMEFDDGYADSWTDKGVKKVTVNGEEVYVQALTGTRTHQSTDGTMTYVQDITGIKVQKIEDPDHPGEYIYRPMYKTDELGNTIYDIVTGEAVYQTLNDAGENEVHIPLRSITKQTQEEFYRFVGTTDIDVAMDVPTAAKGAEEFSETKTYQTGDYVYHTESDGTKQLYIFNADHTGPWTGTDVTTVARSTVQKMMGSNIWQNEQQIIQIVGEVQITDTTPTEAQTATGFSESKRYYSGDYVWYPATGSNRGLYMFIREHFGAWNIDDVDRVQTQTVTIKHGSGLAVGRSVQSFSSTKNYSAGDIVYYNGQYYQFTTKHDRGAWIGTDAVIADPSLIDGDGMARVGLFENGMLNAGLIVDSLNDGSSITKIRGDIIDITARSGSGITIEQDGSINITVNDLINNVNTNASLKINANRINLTSGAIIKAVNGGADGASELTIDADKLNLTGYVNADNFATTMGEVFSLGAHSLSIDTQFETQETCQATFDGPTYFNGSVNIYDPGYLSADTIYLSTISDGDHDALAGNILVNAQLINSGSTLRLTKLDGTNVDFSKVTSLSGTWSDDGTLAASYTVSGSPSGIVTPVTMTPNLTFSRGTSPYFSVNLVTIASEQGIPVETVHKSRNAYLIAGTNVVEVYDNPNGTGNPIASIQTSGGTPASIVKTGNDLTSHNVIVKALDSGGTEVLSNVPIAATDIYNDGWTNCLGQLVLPTQNTSSNTMSLTVPATQPDARPDSPIQYTVSADNSYVYIKAGSVTYAQDSNPAFNNGKMAVTLNDPTYNAIQGPLTDRRTITVSTSGRTPSLEKSETLILNQGAWNTTTNVKTVTMTTSAGTSIASISVDASSLVPDGVLVDTPSGAVSTHSDGTTVTNNSSYYYIKTEGSDATASNALAYSTLRCRLSKNGSAVSGMTYNLAMKVMTTNLYKHAYVKGYDYAIPDWISIGAAAGIKGHLDANGNTITEITNDSNQAFYIETHGTGSAGANASVHMVVYANVRNAGGTSVWSSNANDKNIVMHAPMTQVYKVGYTDGYSNGNTAGKTAVTINPTWTYTMHDRPNLNVCTIAVSTSGRSPASTSEKDITLDVTSNAWNASTHQKQVYIKNPSNTVIASAAVNATEVYNAGVDAITGEEIELAGAGTSDVSTTKPTASISKNSSGVSPYIWVKKSDNKWYRLRQTTISNGATAITAAFRAVWDSEQNVYVPGSRLSSGLYRVGS